MTNEQMVEVAKDLTETLAPYVISGDGVKLELNSKDVNVVYHSLVGFTSQHEVKGVDVKLPFDVIQSLGRGFMSDAVKYFQKNGLKASKELVEMGFGFCSLEDGLSFHTDQLKQLVESYELVKSRGGLDAAKHELILLQKHLNNTFGYVTIITSEKIENLKQAIADVESCMEVSSESN